MSKNFYYHCPKCNSKHIMGIALCSIPADISTWYRGTNPVFEIPANNDEMFSAVWVDPWENADSGVDWYCSECGFAGLPTEFEYDPAENIKLYLCDNDTLYTLPELKKEYGDLCKSGDIDPVDYPFTDWLFNATDKNGSLTRIYAGTGIDETLSKNSKLYIDRASDSITTESWLKQKYCNDVKTDSFYNDMSFTEWIDNNYCWPVYDENILSYLLEELRK